MNNKYCVYVHKDKENIVRYVGSGTISRAKLLCAKSDRGARYEDFVTTNGQMQVEILHSNQTKENSLLLEAALYDSLKSEFLLNSKRPIVSTNTINAEILTKVVYSETSPTYLVWNQDIICNNAIRYKAGSTAGYRTKTGYYSVGLNGKHYRVHRIVFSLCNPDINITNLVIDHIDGDPSNNRITNLRAVSHQVNNRNLTERTIKRELPTGVYWRPLRNAFVAQVVDPTIQHSNGTGKLIRTYIPVHKFQDQENPHEAAKQFAIQTRKQMLEEINNRLNLGYTADHGT